MKTVRILLEVEVTDDCNELDAIQKIVKEVSVRLSNPQRDDRGILFVRSAKEMP